MLWFVLSIIGATADAGYYISVKNFLQTTDPHILAAGGYSCTGIILLLISWIHGFPAIGDDFAGALIASSALGIFAILLSFAALKHTDISLAVPMISFTPFFLILTAFLLLHELPSPLGIAGIVTIVAGSYVLNLSSSHKKLADPFRAIVTNRGVVFMLIVSLIYAVAINFDRIIVANSDPVFGSSIACLVLGLSFVVISVATRLRDRKSSKSLSEQGGPQKRGVAPETAPVLHYAGPFALLGVLLSVAAVSINSAYTLQIVPYVIAIKRMSIIITVLYGAFVFREDEVVRRVAGAALMVAGAVLIVVSI